MKLDFASHKLEDAANGEENGTYSKMTQIIRQRLGRKSPCVYEDIVATLNDLVVADSCAGLPRSLNFHALQGELRGRFAVDIKIPSKGGRYKYRMILSPNHGADDPEFRIDNYKTIKKIMIEELCVDYH